MAIPVLSAGRLIIFHRAAYYFGARLRAFLITLQMNANGNYRAIVHHPEGGLLRLSTHEFHFRSGGELIRNRDWDPDRVISFSRPAVASTFSSPRLKDVDVDPVVSSRM